MRVTKTDTLVFVRMQVCIEKASWCSLQEGFNARATDRHQFSNARARLGLVANEQTTCNSFDSFIGIGTKYTSFKNSVGNLARHSPDNGNVNIRAMAYIMARWYIARSKYIMMTSK